jgi:hypothetical protein
MRIYRFVSTAIGGIFMAGMSTAAFAGCGGNTTCDPNVRVHNNHVEQQAHVNVYNTAPYGYLKTFEYQNGQNVNITRVHSRTPYVSLSDAPSAYTNGCAPTSTAYCRSNQGTPVNVVLNQPPAPVVAAPVRSHVTYGSGYNSAAFASRQYGSTDFVPGIAHVPTSIVDRSPITHIDGIPQPQVRSVTTASSGHSSTATSYGHRSNTVQHVRNYAPHRPTGPNVIGSVVTGQYTYQPPGGGQQYWEKTSGPTIVDGLPATQIICRREAPRPAPVNVRVVRPVIGVPTLAGCAPAKPVCAPVCKPKPKPVVCAPVNTGCAPAAQNSRYGSRWTH